MKVFVAYGLCGCVAETLPADSTHWAARESTFSRWRRLRYRMDYLDSEQVPPVKPNCPCQLQTTLDLATQEQQ